ncbi:lipopolysaccharide heptosyltransferase I [Alkalilimnicola sp. S0819]|uniref:lipopolysaccharide heptosyltransferase I n=1 Tax=Alkalilimnicola sp. S0819 TaxID=2613922 RepID=UPI00126294A5|nr:lipopolysaccharide heptosyltransferase I [Alkalilimnicola sp. S0819]KAB7627329.1 lipopolysaccharide heptosyltransferase I [Alkalilimnicola sp. S0819]MPQ16045.1 lipopolysaccharide heptosyltransferase I [Alkalilimnicola sp. S0819]
MRLLLIKTSSLGDVVHTLPALSDALAARPDLRVDWVVEEAFAPIARRHPAVARVIPCALRRWRKHPWRAWRSGEWRAFREQLKGSGADRVLDAQGLIKSAFIARLAPGPRHGLDARSAREPLSARVLDVAHAVPRGGHAIDRLRDLFAQALDYPRPHTAPDYGLRPAARKGALAKGARLMFIHGTTWATKHWPESYWRVLAERAVAEGLRVELPWGNEAERLRAERLAEGLIGVRVLPKLSLDELLVELLDCDGFVAVDTGIAHLAAAAGQPGVALYGPTSADLTGVLGARARSLAAEFPCAPCLSRRCSYTGPRQPGVEPPCFGELPPARVWEALRALSRGEAPPPAES